MFHSIDNFNNGVYVARHVPIILSQVTFESLDYGHGMKPMTSTIVQAKNFKDSDAVSAAKGMHFSVKIMHVACFKTVFITL